MFDGNHREYLSCPVGHLAVVKCHTRLGIRTWFPADREASLKSDVYTSLASAARTSRRVDRRVWRRIVGSNLVIQLIDRRYIMSPGIGQIDMALSSQCVVRAFDETGFHLGVFR